MLLPNFLTTYVISFPTRLHNFQSVLFAVCEKCDVRNLHPNINIYNKYIFYTKAKVYNCRRGFSEKKKNKSMNQTFPDLTQQHTYIQIQRTMSGTVDPDDDAFEIPKRKRKNCKNL